MKIAIMGGDTAAKSAIIIALSKEIDILDLPLQQISINFTTEIKLVIYITNSDPDEYAIDQLHEIYESMILMSQVSNPLLRDNDLWISIAPFENHETEAILIELFSIRKFLYKLNPEIPPLTEIQLQVLDHYYRGSSKDEASAVLNISPRTYQNILTDVRILFGVRTNRELVHLVSIPRLLAS